jgi:beta-lactamase superfamily II metal-dependent hydrolase
LIKVCIFNVQHGDSIVVECDDGQRKHFGVIDSNRESSTGEPPAIRYLRSQGVSELSFVMLTHPHADHFRGLWQILDAFPVKHLYSYPMSTDKARMQAVGDKYVAAAKQSGNPGIASDAKEFARFIITAHKKWKANELEWIEITGPTSRIRPFGFESVTINAILPFSKYRGEYIKLIDSLNADAVQSAKQNTLSIAIEILYQQHRIALCGDATKATWLQDYIRDLDRSDERPNFDIVKISHHGSIFDNDGKVLDNLYSANPKQQQFALISAPGTRHHPSPELLRDLKSRSISPYCTNLSTVCGNNVRYLLDPKSAEPEIVKLLTIYGATPKIGSKQPCQGDICVELSSAGVVVKPQYDHPCLYREGFPFPLLK